MSSFNQEKIDALKKRAENVRIGGKGTVRRKKKIVRKTATTDDKKFQATIKRLGVNQLPGIEEVCMYNTDGTVRVFKQPKLQAGTSNTFVLTGNSEVKKQTEHKTAPAEEEVPDLQAGTVNFEEVANENNILETDAASSTVDPQELPPEVKIPEQIAVDNIEQKVDEVEIISSPEEKVEIKKVKDKTEENGLNSWEIKGSAANITKIFSKRKPTPSQPPQNIAKNNSHQITKEGGTLVVKPNIEILNSENIMTVASKNITEAEKKAYGDNYILKEARNLELKKLLTNEATKETTEVVSIEKKFEQIDQVVFDTSDSNRQEELSTLSKVLAQSFEETGNHFELSKNPNESNIRALDSGRNSNVTVFNITLPDNFVENKTFEQVVNDPTQLKTLELQVRESISKATGVPLEEIVVLQVEQGSYSFVIVFNNAQYDLKSQMSDLKNQIKADEDYAKYFKDKLPPALKNINNTISAEEKKDIVVQHLIWEQVKSKIKDNLGGSVSNLEVAECKVTETFKISANDYDKKGDFNFPKPTGDKQIRGKLEYIQPNSQWKRYGLRVLGLYPDGDDWIQMNGNQNEWAVGFHGTGGSPGGRKDSNLDVMNKIMDNRTIAIGSANAYCNRDGKVYKNGVLTSKKVPNGIYFAANVEQCYYNTVNMNGKNYDLAFQCRIHPEHTFVPDSNPSYRIVDSPIYVRPYGILLRKKN